MFPLFPYKLFHTLHFQFFGSKIKEKHTKILNDAPFCHGIQLLKQTNFGQTFGDENNLFKVVYEENCENVIKI